MRPWIFVSVLILLVVLICAVLLAPYIGLGQDYGFVLYKLIGVSRGQAFFWLRLLLVFFCVAQLLLIQASEIRRKEHWRSVKTSIRVVGAETRQALFIDKKAPTTRTEWLHSGIICAFFLALLPLFLFRNLEPLSEQNDLQWYYAFIDYDIDWRTPLFSLAGNLLNHFGVQVPVNANLAPLIRLAHILSVKFQIVIAVALFSVAFGALFWAFGRIIGLRPVPCSVFAGIITLVLNIPFGLEKVQITIGIATIAVLLWTIGQVLGLRPVLRLVLIGLCALLLVDVWEKLYVFPPSLFTIFLTLIFWWQEAALITLTSVCLFFFLGQKQMLIANLGLALGFAALCYLVLLAFPIGAIFAVPVISLYCLASILTSASRKEFLWKAISGAALALAMVATKIPDFFLNLYAYSWGYYFVNLVSSWDRNTLLSMITMAISLSHVDFRMAPFIILTIGTLCFLAVRGPGRLRRLAFCVLFVEIGILLIGILNAFTLNIPIASAYLEVFHTGFLLAFFVLFILFIMTALVLTPGVLKRSNISQAAPHFLSPKTRLALLWLVALAAIASYKFLDRTPFRPLIFPPEQPPSVQLLQSELQLKPGEPFRGRVLVLAGMLAPAGDQWPGASGSIQDVLEFHYRTILGNDHYVHLLPFGLSVATDFGHWTSALTFIFLHKFFVRKDDIISNKAFFPLRAFNNRIARLLGIRMVVTDAPTLEDTSLVYETKAGNADLRIFRVDNVNLGQYSPTHPIKVAYASEALSTLAASDFDPQRDAVVEQEAPDNLVKVDSASVITDFGPTLSINAYSSGWSLLVLPFEYSHCLRLETQQGTSGQLFPVNLQQTGLLFERRITARIFYRYGPFDRPQCRRADLDRINRLHLRDAL